MNTQQPQGLRNPFGEISCEYEVEILKEHYQEYYYNRGRFNVEVTDEDTYLIVGRRGSGKTSLAKYLEFQPDIKNARCIDVDEPEVYDEVFRKTHLSSYPSDDLLIGRMVKLWDYIIWNLIFHTFQEEDPIIRAACMIKDHKKSPARLIAEILKHLISRFIDDDEGRVVEEIEQFIASKPFAEGQKRVLEITSRQPIIVAIDTLERYNKDDEKLMSIVAGLIQSASWFNISFVQRGVHIKVFVSAEIFPHIKDSVISNTTKYIRNPVYLHWRPRDLIHLICWRFYKYLKHRQEQKLLTIELNDAVDWSNFNSVVKNMWLPFFGETLTNGKGIEEKTFPYILRHTQMRPRQLVELCNKIARYSEDHKTFPDFSRIPISQIVKETERELANEVLNSYARIYPRVSDIVDALQGFPMIFQGSELDKFAKQSTPAWPTGTYSPDNFRKLVAELGIVGRVRSQDTRTRIVAADFEYGMVDRLPLQSSDTCVIHPMFYSRLHTNVDQQLVVYPFPDHPDFELLRESYYPGEQRTTPTIQTTSARRHKPKNSRQK